MKKSNKTIKILKAIIIILFLLAIFSVIISIINGLQQAAIEPTKIDLSLDEVVF